MAVLSVDVAVDLRLVRQQFLAECMAEVGVIGDIPARAECDHPV